MSRHDDVAAYPFRNVVSSTNQTLMVDMRPILVGRKS